MSDKTTDSIFGERFAFARDHGNWYRQRESDSEFAHAVRRTKATVSEWRRMAGAPPVEICQLIAERTGVDPGWLMAGERSSAAPPPDFKKWLATYRAKSPSPEPAPEFDPAQARTVEEALAEQRRKKKPRRRRSGGKG